MAYNVRASQVSDTNAASRPIEVMVPEGDNVIDTLDDSEYDDLKDFLLSRLLRGLNERDTKLRRYSSIDRIISTYQKLNKADSERLMNEEHSGRQYAISMNMPLLATHLDDMTAFFSEIFSPLSGEFFANSGKAEYAELAKRMNVDARSRGHYTQVVLAIRSLLKYNVGGFHVEWHEENSQGNRISRPGNQWTALDMYNTLWDPTVKDVDRVSTEAEWAAVVELKNRLWLIKKGLSGEYSRVDGILGGESNRGNPGTTTQAVRFWRSPPAQAGMPADGGDSTSAADNQGQTQIDWNAYGLGAAHEGTIEHDGHEVITMYCWIRPTDFGLINASEQDAIKTLGINARSFVELWRFTIVDGCHIVAAEPVVPREEMNQRLGESLTGEHGGINGRLIPIFLSFMSHDQLKEAQRSTMELMRGFQRFMSYLFNVYIAGMRKNVWGTTVVDPTAVDTTGLEAGDVAGILKSMRPGHDVRMAITKLDSSAGVENALGALDGVMTLVSRMFPAQAMPSQVAGIDRAVKSQVSAVMQGAVRRLHMTARLIDSSLFTPAYTESYRNLARYDQNNIGDLTDEDVAAMLGTGLASLEAERVVDSLLELINRVMQNKEAMQQVDFLKILTYVSRLMNIGIDLGEFARAQPGDQGGQPTPDAPGGPGEQGGQIPGNPMASILGAT